MTHAMAPTFPVVDLPHLAGIALPAFHEVRIRQPFEPALDDLAGSVVRALDGSAHLFDLGPGAPVAVAVGSRGIARIDEIARVCVGWLKSRGFVPFIVPAMGSHGGGTAEGQRGVLAALGVTEAAMGCEIRSSMETVTYGTIATGATCHFDANAAGADGVLVINRVKAHTSYDRPVESGLTKMLAVGLGKAQGAAQVHVTGPRGLADVLPRLAERVIERSPLKAGLALLENADKGISHVEIAAPSEFHATDERLLIRSKAAMARLPFDRLDGLIIEEVGKDISGSGIDPAISGRTDIRGVENPATPFIHKIVALGLSARTGGNGLGVGMADFIPRRLAHALDLKAMYMNSVTATILEKSFIPIVLPDDRTCLRALVATCWADGPPRLCQIRSSLHLDRIRVTEALLPELRRSGAIIEEGAARPPEFDEDGNLVDLLGGK